MSEDTGSCGGGGCEGEGSEGSTASVREDHSIITVAAEPDNRLTTVVISSGDNTSNSNGGIDNLAFQSDTLHSLGENEAPPAEAVNLELVNMTPFGEKEKLGNGNGTEIPVKNGKDADSAATDSSLPEGYNNDPYDEYFVPVNEHRKYIRGEKLYVTKDKRQQSKWRRTVCWGVALTLLAAAALIAVLAATGVILTQEENPTALMNERLASSTTTTMRPIITEDLKIPTRPPTLIPGLDIDQPYVPRAVEGQLTINDMEFNEELSRPDSREFKKLAKSLEDEIKMTLFDHQTLNYGATDITIKVIDFMPGSVIVRYRIAWTPKPGIHNAPDPINRDSLRDKMTLILDRNGGYLYVYRIPSSSLTSKHILDPCKANNGGCSHTCSFDYNNTLLTACSCPSTMKLAPDATTCIDALVEVEDPIINPSRGTSVESARHFPDELPTQHHFNPTTEETDHVHSHESSSPEPEPEPEPDQEHSHPEPTGDHDHHDMVTPEPSSHEDESSPEPTSDKDHEHVNPEPTGDHDHVEKASPEPSDSHINPEEGSPEPSDDHDHVHPDDEASPEPSSDNDHEHVHAEIVLPEPSDDNDHAHPEPSSDKDHDHNEEASPEPGTDSHNHPEDVNPEPEPSGDDTDTHKSKYIEHIMHEHDSAEKHDEAKSEPEPQGDKENMEHNSKETESSEHDKIKPEPSPTDDDESHHYHIHHDHTKHEHDADNHPKAEPSPDTEDKESVEHHMEGSIPQSEMEHVQKHPDLHMMQIVHMTEMPMTTVEPSSKLEMDAINKSGEIENNKKETSTLESEVVSEKSEPEPASDNEDKKDMSHEKNIESVPDQEYSDHRESDDEDVIGIPVILELKPRPIIHENKNDSSVENQELDNETEINKDAGVIENLSHTESSSQTPEENKTEKSETDEHHHESMAMMERNNEGNLVHTTEKERHIEIVHLVPLNMTSDISGELKQQREEQNENKSNMDISDVEDKNEIKSESTSESTINLSHEHQSSTTTSTESNTNNDLSLDQEDKEKNSEIHSVGDTSNVLVEDTKTKNKEQHENTTESIINKENSNILFINEKEKHEEKISTDEDSVKPVHEEINENPPSSPIMADGSIVEITPSPSTTTHVPSSEHSPTSEPERAEDYDANNDLLGPLEENEEKKHVLKSPRFENSEIQTKNGSESHNEELNDIFLKEKDESSNSNTDTKLEQSRVESTTENLINKIQTEDNMNTESITTEGHNLGIFEPKHEESHEMKNMDSEKIVSEMPSSSAAVTEKLENIEETFTKKPEKKFYKSKPFEKNHEELSDIKMKDDHMKMDRLGVALDFENKEEEETTLIPTTEIPQMMDENGEGKIDVRLKLDDENEKTEQSEENTTEEESTEKTKEIDEKKVLIEEKNMPADDSPITTETANSEMATEMPHKEEEKIESKENLETELDHLNNEEQSTMESITEKIIENKDKEINISTDAPVTESEISTEFSERLDKQDDNENNLKSINETDKTETEDKNEDENKTEEPIVDSNKENETSTKSEEKELKSEVIKEEIEIKTVPVTTTPTPTTRSPAPVREEPSIPVTADPTTALGFSKCTAGQFQCVNGTSHMGQCVSLSAKCDSVNDCSDASDEFGCIEDGCPGNFQCSNGQCLKRHLVCNGIIDCNDSSDEADCEKWQCKFDELKCPSGRCIPLLWQCDGKADCEDHTDEQNCHASCGNQEYMCPERWCIPLSWRCNGRPDCAQGDDEKLCDCSVDQFQCSAGGCVAKSQVCDGEGQCPDLSDEWNCLRVNNETLQLQVRSSESEWLGVCSDDWDNSWSNAACQALGYSDAVFTEYPLIEEENGDRLLKLKPSSGNATMAPLLGSLEKAPRQSCTSGKAVEISCQDFNCGSQHGASVGLEARLVGGDRAADGQWPSVALVYNTKQGAGCTGSIVSPVWLLTSLSCLTNKDRSLTSSQWQVHAGGSVFIPNGDQGRMQTREVRNIVSHPQARFNRFLYEEDVALVRLSRPLVLNGPVVGAICLTSRSIEPRQLCVTAGWGYTSRSARDGSLSQYLHYLPVPTIDLKECNSSRHYNGLVSKNHVCAGYTDAERSPCDNDEGAPLMCINEAEGVWELQGLLSYHSHCGRGFHPSIFTSVPALRPWVDSTLGSHFSATPAHNLRR